MKKKEDLNEKMIENLLELDKKSEKLPVLTEGEKSTLEADNKFESVYFSNKLEGNKLSSKEAKNAILSDKS